MSQENDLEFYEKDDDDVHMFDDKDELEVNDDDQKTQNVANEAPSGLNPLPNAAGPSLKARGRGRALTSPVWADMERVIEGNEVYAICNRCKMKLKAKSENGTKSLHMHLKRCKKRANMDIRQQFLQVKEKMQEGKVEYCNYVFDQDVSRNHLADMIVLHEYPLSIVNHHGFKLYSSSLNPLLRMVTRNTIKSDIIKIYHAKREKIIKLLEELDSRVAITTDLWSAKPTKRGFMAITAHYIDDLWVLQSRLLRFVYVPAPHNGEVLTNYVFNSLIDLNLDRKLSTITVDNATSNDSMIGKIGDRLDPNSLLMKGNGIHMRCCAHVLNLIVQDGLDVIKKELENVRNSVVYWIGSASRIQRFEEAARQLSIPHTKKLILDCPTRWNSTYLMLETALLYQKVFPRLKLKERNYNCVPSEEDWEKVKEITEKLKLFYNATLMFSGSSYPTSNEFFAKICELKVELNNWLQSPKKYIQEMAKKMVEKFDKYWNVCHEIMGVACVLDPRYKMKLCEFYLPRVHGGDASFHIERIRKCCYDLLNEYQSRDCSDDNGIGTSLSCTSDVRQNDNDPLSIFDKFVTSTSSNVNVKSELDFYLEENVLPRTTNFDILSWWKTNGVKFPTLRKMARDILAIPISSVASEEAFSTSGRLISPHRSRLAPNTLEALMCTQSWLRNENKAPFAEADKLGKFTTCNDDAMDDDNLAYSGTGNGTEN